MKKIVRPISFLAFLAMAATSCQKDNNDILFNAGEKLDGFQMQYKVSEISRIVKLSNDNDWDLFMDDILALVRNGYTVEITGTSPSAIKYKETIIFTTTNANEVKIWVNNMVSQGYAVTVSYDENTGVFTCIARK